MSDWVLTEQRGLAGICTLNRPDKRNPISAEMRSALRAAMEQFRGDSGIRAVIVTGAGSAFCSGLDLDGLAAIAKSTPAQNLADSQSIAAFFDYVYHYPKPTIAALNGPAVAGGCGLALVCDFTLAVPDAFLAFTEVKIGFIPAIVGVYLRQMVGEKTARDLLLTGRKITAAEAKELRLITDIVGPADQLMDRSIALVSQLAKNSPTALTSTKALLAEITDICLSESMQLASKMNANARSTPDCNEGIEAFLQKRKPKWDDSR